MKTLTEGMRDIIDSMQDTSGSTELVDLIRSGADISDAWPDITVHGHDLLDMYMNWADDVGARYGNNGFAQEVYLGYSPSKNRFYSGWDGLFDRWDSEMYSESGHMIFELTVWKDGQVTGSKYSHGSGIFYMDNYNSLKAHIPDLVDIRLD